MILLILEQVYYLSGSSSSQEGTAKPFSNSPVGSTRQSPARLLWIAGTLLVSLMGFSLAMVPVMLYPILKRRNEVLALGAVLFLGAIEVISYTVIVTSMLLMVSVSDLSQSVGATDLVNFQFAGSMLAAANDWTAMWGAIVFSLGALMIYAAFYQARLVPRWLSAWGFLGGVLYFASNLISLFSPHHVAPSLNGGIGMLMIPLAIQEMVFAVCMIARGFNLSAVATLSAKVETS
jgi:hypothetical protein